MSEDWRIEEANKFYSVFFAKNLEECLEFFEDDAELIPAHGGPGSGKEFIRSKFKTAYKHMGKAHSDVTKNRVEQAVDDETNKVVTKHKFSRMMMKVTLTDEIVYEPSTKKIKKMKRNYKIGL